MRILAEKIEKRCKLMAQQTLRCLDLGLLVIDKVQGLLYFNYTEEVKPENYHTAKLKNKIMTPSRRQNKTQSNPSLFTHFLSESMDTSPRSDITEETGEGPSNEVAEAVEALNNELMDINSRKRSKVKRLSLITSPKNKDDRTGTGSQSHRVMDGDERHPRPKASRTQTDSDKVVLKRIKAASNFKDMVAFSPIKSSNSYELESPLSKKNSIDELPQRTINRKSTSYFESDSDNNEDLSLPTVKIPNFIVPGSYSSIRIDGTIDEIPTDFELKIVEDTYRKQFFGKLHYNFIITENNVLYSIISVLEKPMEQRPTQQIHRALHITHKSSKEFTLLVKKTDVPCDRKDVQQAVREYLATEYSGSTISVSYVSPEISDDILEIEKNHPQKRRFAKIGVICVQDGQSNPQDMLRNTGESVPHAFWEFMNLIGHSKDLIELQYRGDFGIDEIGKTYVEDWKHLQIVYHVAPMLDPEAHRRLIGNDVAIIFFLTKGKLSLSNIGLLGTMPQVYAIVKPAKNNRYKIATFCNVNIKPHGPPTPKSSLDGATLKELLLTKLHNGIVMTTYCPPLARLFFLPRKETIDSIVNKHSKKKKRKNGALTMELPDTWKVQLSLTPPNSVPLKKTDKVREKDVILKIEDNKVLVLDAKTRQQNYEWDIATLQKCKWIDPIGNSKGYLAIVFGKEFFFLKGIESDLKKLESLLETPKKEL
eukprot:TRINITY_DN22335_c0_g1_i1.p1 TRINITY_DN22335_c0_g1~~TRINITY_DN22335_c0_g1_i1.p1  ORF type:complete len:765 (-),score=188.52 TRINITY_DN22335_c0_g1_i1:43-2160(-)